MSTNNAQEIQVGDSLIKTINCEKLLGIKIDYNLIFDNHVNNLCKKAKNKLWALATANSCMNIEKKKLLMNPFFNIQFSYCPLIWMLHSRYNDNKIKYLHKRCLRLTYCDKISSYEELLENLRNHNEVRVPFARAVYHGPESISYLGPKIWDIVPKKIKTGLIF